MLNKTWSEYKVVLLFLSHPYGRDEAGHSSFRFTVIQYFCHSSQLLVLSLHCSSSSAFLMSLFRQSSHLRCGFPCFPQPPCLFDSVHFDKHSSFILTIVSCQLNLADSESYLYCQPSRLQLQYLLIYLSFEFSPTFFTPANLLVQLFSHSCCLRCKR